MLLSSTVHAYATAAIVAAARVKLARAVVAQVAHTASSASAFATLLAPGRLIGPASWLHRVLVASGGVRRHGPCPPLMLQAGGSEHRLVVLLLRSKALEFLEKHLAHPSCIKAALPEGLVACVLTQIPAHASQGRERRVVAMGEHGVEDVEKEVFHDEFF